MERFVHVLPDTYTSNFKHDTLENCILEVGHKRVILKSDQEPAILSLKDGVKAGRHIDIMCEDSRKYKSQSNGAP